MTTNTPTIRTYNVPDISCDHCKNAIEAEVGLVEGVGHVAVDVDSKIVIVTGGDDLAIKAAIDEAGYDVA